jgi:hypothetical protein
MNLEGCRCIRRRRCLILGFWGIGLSAQQSWGYSQLGSWLVRRQLDLGEAHRCVRFLPRLEVCGQGWMDGWLARIEGLCMLCGPGNRDRGRQRLHVYPLKHHCLLSSQEDAMLWQGREDWNQL